MTTKQTIAHFIKDERPIRESHVQIGIDDPDWLLSVIEKLIGTDTIPEEWDTVIIDGNEYTKAEFQLILNVANVTDAVRVLALGLQDTIDNQSVTTESYKEALLQQLAILLGTFDALMQTVPDIDTWATPVDVTNAMEEYQKHKIMNPDIIMPDDKIITNV